MMNSAKDAEESKRAAYPPAKKVLEVGDGNRVPLFCVKISPIRIFPGAQARTRALIEEIEGKRSGKTPDWR